jgi:hypothetical protein
MALAFLESGALGRALGFGFGLFDGFYPAVENDRLMLHHLHHVTTQFLGKGRSRSGRPAIPRKAKPFFNMARVGLPVKLTAVKNRLRIRPFRPASA